MSFEEVKSALIEQLKPLLMEPDFSDMFDKLTASETSTNRFLLKMELNRLAGHCSRIIDLRDKTELACEAVEFNQQTHMLDEPAKQSFFAALIRYQQQYTVGVYEEVIQEHRSRLTSHKQDAQNVSDDSFIVPGVVLGTYFNRCEERMNYSIQITASQSGRTEAKGTTIDLSVGGARIKVSAKHSLDINQPILLKLHELNEEYYYEDLHQGIEYEIVDSTLDGEHAIFRLKRVNGSDDLVKILTNLIRGYKFRYKVDVNEVYTNTLGLGYERHYLPHYRNLPLFLNSTKKVISHCLLSAENQGLKRFFNDERDICQLSQTLSSTRLSQLQADPHNFEHNLLFCFTHNVRETLYFYSATLAELMSSNFTELFFKFGANKSSFKIFRLKLESIDHEQTYKTAVLPGDDSHYSPLVEQQLSQFSHVINLIDLTSDVALETLQNVKSQASPNELKVFAQAKEAKNKIKSISLNFTERRQEPRYSFKTQVDITQGDKSFSGITGDISTKGLQVIFTEPCNLDETQSIKIALPKLQTLAGKAQLVELPYRIVKKRKNGKQLHLAANIGHEPHVGVEFLNRLIIHNQEKLKQLSDSDDNVKELSDGMKNLLMRKLPSTPFFIEKTKKSAKLSAVGVSTQNNEITDLFSAGVANGMEYNLAPIFKQGLFKPIILNALRKMKSTNEMVSVDLFLRLTNQSRGQFQLHCMRADQFKTKQHKKRFIEQSKDTGRFIALRVFYGVTGKPDNRYIAQERDYIAVHAAHKAKILDEKLWNTIGVGDILDVTSEAKLLAQYVP
ncbi:PilZ domain-containing protein [Shewanella sp. 202IG2-18]|uniref:PilZ domain-containing protein n=1 Tax=Parashewanella hymeniacidonis TaxID=2807618 RepID=UPI001960D03C|nr:PilZ domain-containing protein [Parashewanella hymeniacidonis]MBM7071683.1 PilZ domain-containing protein [Parashewanella hymeniacidonis]